MKPATIASSLRPTTALLVLLPLLLIGWVEQAAANPLENQLSKPLTDTTMYTIVQEVAKNAQQMQDDPTQRLLHNVEMENQIKICCLHANILDFYLNNILPHHNSHPKMDLLRINLSRVSSDLQTKGCHVIHYHNHRHIVEFRRRFFMMGGQERLNKAVGEIDILYAFLQDFCVEPMAGNAAQ